MNKAKRKKLRKMEGRQRIEEKKACKMEERKEGKEDEWKKRKAKIKQRKEDGRKENRMEVNKARKNKFLSRFNPVFFFVCHSFAFS